MQMNMFVRNPADLRRISRSRPMTPPRSAARTSRKGIAPTISKSRSECTESPGKLPASFVLVNRLLLKLTLLKQSLFFRISPTQAEHVCATVKLALDGINGTALIKSKHLIVQIQERCNKLQPAMQAVAGL
jgi:hypothetical protein